MNKKSMQKKIDKKNNIFLKTKKKYTAYILSVGSVSWSPQVREGWDSKPMFKESKLSLNSAFSLYLTGF